MTWLRTPPSETVERTSTKNCIHLLYYLKKNVTSNHAIVIQFYNWPSSIVEKHANNYIKKTSNNFLQVNAEFRAWHFWMLDIVTKLVIIASAVQKSCRHPLNVTKAQRSGLISQRRYCWWKAVSSYLCLLLLLFKHFWFRLSPLFILQNAGLHSCRHNRRMRTSWYWWF